MTRIFIILLLAVSTAYPQMYDTNTLNDDPGARLKVRENFNYLNQNKLDTQAAEQTYITKSSVSATYANYATTEGLYLRKSSATAHYASIDGNTAFAGFTALGNSAVNPKVKLAIQQGNFPLTGNAEAGVTNTTGAAWGKVIAMGLIAYDTTNAFGGDANYVGDATYGSQVYMSIADSKWNFYYGTGWRGAGYIVWVMYTE